MRTRGSSEGSGLRRGFYQCAQPAQSTLLANRTHTRDIMNKHAQPVDNSVHKKVKAGISDQSATRQNITAPLDLKKSALFSAAYTPPSGGDRVSGGS